MAAPMADDALRYGASALAACRDVVSAIGPDDLRRATPCTEYDVDALTDHLVRSMVLLAGSAGTTLQPSASGSPEQRIVPLADAALQAWDARGLDGVVPVGSRTRPAPLAYAIVLLELVVHGWDLATALARPFSVDDDLAEHLLRQVPLLITPDKRGTGFAAEVPVAADAAPLARLLAFTGRQP